MNSIDKFFDKLENYWHLRLTTMDEMDKITSLVVTLGSTKYIISNELTHYHCLIYTETKITHMRKILKESNYCGNGKYSLAKVKAKSQMIKYVLKDGHYIYKGFPSEMIESLSLQSYNKDKEQFSKELHSIEEEYYKSTRHDAHRIFGCAFLQLKAKYNQRLYGNHIKAYLDLHKCKKYGRTWSEKYYDNLYKYDN